MKTKDGGPAFPGSNMFDKEVYEDLRPTEGINQARRAATFSFSGMSLRDWFAGQALAGIMATSSWDHRPANSEQKDIAEDCYALADAMLAERGGNDG